MTQFRRVSPFEVREPVVDFFWRMRAWPYPSRDDYFKYWDWRYSSLSDEEPVVWVAMDGGQVVGHIALYLRRYRLDGAELRIGVPGNFLVDNEHRDTMIGARLASSPRALVRDAELDVLLSYGNRIAHGMFLRMGARDLGAMKFFVDVHRWGAVLSRSIPGGELLAPMASLVAGARKAIRRGRIGRVDPALAAREFSIDDIMAMDRHHWSRSGDSLTSDSSATYLANRFLRCPVRSHRVYGVTDTASGRLEGLVITEDFKRVKVWACEVNESAITASQAVAAASRAMPEVESVVVPLLPDSTLAAEFDRAGYMRRRSTGEVEESTWWSAYWQPTHSLASRFAELKCWKLWYASNHH